MKKGEKTTFVKVLIISILFLTSFYGLDAAQICVNTVVNHTCSINVTGKIDSAVAGAVSGDTIIVGDNSTPMPSLGCKSLYSNEVINATGKKLDILADTKEICVSGGTTSPLIKYDNSGSSSLSGFKMWIRGSKSIVLTKTTLLLDNMPAIGDSPIGIQIDSSAKIDLVNSTVTRCRFGVRVGSNGAFFGTESVFTFNEQAFFFAGNNRSELFQSVVSFNKIIGSVLSSSEVSFKDNEFSFNEGRLYIGQNSKSTLLNNLYYKNKSIDNLVIVKDLASAKIVNSTFAENQAPKLIDIAGSSKVSMRDTIIAKTSGTGVKCGSTVPTYMDYDNFFGNTMNYSGCAPTLSTTLDPKFVTGPLGSFYLDQAGSPMVNGGSSAANTIYSPFYTTDPSHIADGGQVDVGYHYNF